MAAGWVRFEKLDPGEYVSAGGIAIPMREKFSRTVYGKVISCGKYQDRQGNSHDSEPHYPLPAETIVEIRNHDPWQNHDSSLSVPTYDIMGFWLPGQQSPLDFKE